MKISLEGKVALVTGASSGIGVGIAKVLVECGAQVVITGREQSAIDKVAAEIGSCVTAIAADVPPRATWTIVRKSRGSFRSLRYEPLGSTLLKEASI